MAYTKNLSSVSSPPSAFLLIKLETSYSVELTFKNKEDWKCSGFDTYHRLYYRFNQNLNGEIIGNNTTDNIDISLINLKGWIIRYWAYKFCKDKMHDQIEDFFLKDCDTVNDSNELDLIMYELDNKILQRCRAIIF